MPISVPRVPLPSPVPVPRRESGLGATLQRELDAGASDFQSEVTPTAMTIAMINDSQTRWDTASVAARLAELAVTDELIVVYGSDEHGSEPSVLSVVARLRDLLPRHTVIVLYVAPHRMSLRRDAALLDDFLEVGILPIVVTAAEAVSDTTAELALRLHADRVLTMAYTLTGGTDVEQMWAVSNELVTCAA